MSNVRRPIVYFIVYFIVMIALGIVGGFYFKYAVPFLRNHYTAINVSDSLAVYNANFELELVKTDLDTYGTISPKVEKIILYNIKDVSQKRHIPIGLLHCIFRVESEYRFNIDHPTVTVMVEKHFKGVDNKGRHVNMSQEVSIKTHAIGLGGVMWCYWKDSLRAEGIAQEESDLYLPDVNIQASGYILSVITQKVMKDSHVSSYNMLNDIIKAYYGAYNSIYFAKMVKITSDLWLTRIARAIMKEYKR